MAQDRDDLRPPGAPASRTSDDMGAAAAELEHADGAAPTRAGVQVETPLKPHRRAAGDPLA